MKVRINLKQLERDLDETKRSEECYETYCRGFGSDIGLVRLLYLG
jgi:hypothetical protein